MNEWISVKNRLPEHCKDVLVLHENGRIGIEWVDSLGAFAFDDLYGGVTHWMPLPEPPGTEQNAPLTLDELREMDGEPVWVQCLKRSKYIDPPVGWRILEKSIYGSFGVRNGENCFVERDYGTDWLAYRRKPEEATK